ncbi:rod shape-determining protein [Ilyobacter polytropus]|uniref:Cell shape-determining protein MreB n=1 Tax=Ilyobacter polytropus (strain ATCC 51220 / DSM 2926 / LMG 16218 / CuHBu1) TaxID=572544 RepID=E3H6G0_ILYPC|nr:rod shape-determining protein [Ilyobacter polytropus]ADO82373.1 rod shape-determining protein MreB [Ilyobacter polytropus DSM 2926]
MLKAINKALGMFSEDLGIDLGTANTLVCVKNKGVVLNEPSVVAVNNKTKEIYAVGDKAKRMIGRTPAVIDAIRPLKNGVIADYEVTEKMLREFYKRVHKRKFLANPRVVICVPAGVTQVEKRAVIDVTREAGAREAYLIEEPMAAAIGAGLNIFEPDGNFIIDIGGGTTEIAVISLGGIVKTSSLRVAGDKFDTAIVQYVRQKHNLLIGDKTAEEIKVNVGSAIDLEEELTIEISGRNVLNGLPKNVSINSSEIKEALDEMMHQIIEEIKVILEKTPPELSSDIKRKGIVLVGGGALIRGIDKKISDALQLSVQITEFPLNAVVMGIEELLKNFEKYREVIISPETDY